MGRNDEIPRFANVLIARFSALGDVAMTVPVIYSVCAAYPHVNFIMITQEVPALLFINAPSNLTVLGFDIKTRYHGVAGLWRLCRELRSKYHIDAFVDLHYVLRTHFISLFLRLAGIPCRHINKGRRGKRALTRASNKRMLPLISSRARYREVFHRFGFSFDETFTSIFGDERANPAAFAEISAPKPAGELWIAVAPFAKHRGKIYPLPLMAKVVDAMAAWYNVRIFLFGAGEQERDILHPWAERHENVVSLAEKRYGFPVELSLLSYCDVMLSMDSANMHLAALVKLTVVSVWGATHPYCGFMGWHQSERNAVQLNMTCRPCSVFGNKPCYRGDYYCLAGIPPSLMISKVKEVLDGKCE